MDKVKVKSPEEIRKYLEEENLPVTERAFIENLLRFAEEMRGEAYAEHVAIHIWKLCVVEPYEVFLHNLDAAARILVPGPHAVYVISNEINTLHRMQRMLLRDELKTKVDEAFPIF